MAPGLPKNPFFTDRKTVKPPSTHLLWRSLGYLRTYRKPTLGAYLTLIGINALALAIPQFIRWIVDYGIGGKNIPVLVWSVIALLGSE